MLKIDTTINLPVIASVIVAIASAGAWISSVNTRLDKVAELVTHTDATDRRLDALEANLKGEILLSREETIKNRQVGMRILKERQR